jgi:hypothetical protein
MKLKLLPPDKLPTKTTNSPTLVSSIESYSQVLATGSPEHSAKVIQRILVGMDATPLKTSALIEEDSEHHEYDVFFRIERVISLSPSACFFRSVLICHLSAFEYIRSYPTDSEAIACQMKGMKAQVDLLARIFNEEEQPDE